MAFCIRLSLGVVGLDPLVVIYVLAAKAHVKHVNESLEATFVPHPAKATLHDPQG
jgi:hypothetical protein